MQSFIDQLHLLLLAPYPILMVETYEEERTIPYITALVEQSLKRQIEFWNGFSSPKQSLTEYFQALLMEKMTSVFIIVDAHRLIRTAQHVRLLREIATHFTETNSTLIFVGPIRVEIPEIAREIEILSVPLPEQPVLTKLLTDLLTEQIGYDLERISKAASGLTLREAHRAFIRTRYKEHIAQQKNHLPRDKTFYWEASVMEEKRRLIQQTKTLTFHELNTKLEDLGGLENLKTWLKQRRSAFSERAALYGIPSPKGLLLVGVQGCGKSLAAKAVAGFWELPLLRLELGSLFSHPISPDAALREALVIASAMSPVVLWVDELEKSFEEQNGETQRVLAVLLTWLQEKQDPVFFVATANKVALLPPELLRRGRFDEIFFVDLPDRDAREAILRIHIKAKKRNPKDFNLAEIAKITEHYSGAELEQVVIAGLYHAFKADLPLKNRDLVLATRQMIPLYKMYEIEIKEMRTWSQGRARQASQSGRLTDILRDN